MAKKQSLHNEMKLLTKYLISDSSENAKRPLLYPFFQKLYPEKFKIENDAKGADGYVEGVFILETKTDSSVWLAGFYQALHYHRQSGLVYQLILVIASKFVGVWRVNQIPEHAFLLYHSASPLDAPSFVGKNNARKTPQHVKKEIEEAALYFIEPKRFDKILQKNEAVSFGFDGKNNFPLFGIDFLWYEVTKILTEADAGRIQIDTHNFINQIELLKEFFDHPIEAVHAFYTLIAYWDITSTLAVNDYTGEVQLVGFKGRKLSDPIAVKPALQNRFKKFVENRYIFTNEGSGLTVDYYFSRFDEVMSRIDPEYVKQHGIFFTDVNLSRFALWFAKRILGEQVNEMYIFFDPAGGSGNLISSWRGKQKHKIISELQPDLLRIIERRMRIDPWHVEKGFTIIPKTSENKGLNFLDCDAITYIAELEKELKLKNLELNKPFAFLLNPPYKNTDEHESARESADANYTIHPSILELTGDDAGKERYLAFLGQILNLSKHQAENQADCEPVVMIFTPTSWLIPRPTYVSFREKWDRHFQFLDGFIVTSNEFFKLKGKWPLAFTVWKYHRDDSRTNRVNLYDFTEMTTTQFKNVNWALNDEELNFQVGIDFEKEPKVLFTSERKDIRETIPEIEIENYRKKQTRYDFSRAKKKNEAGKLVSGFPLKDELRHYKLSRTCGSPDGEFIGFMDDNTPVRLNQERLNRFTQKPDRVWLQLRPTFIDVNLTKVQTGPADKYAYTAYDLLSAKTLFTWFCITKAVIQKYPIWANQFNIWMSEFPGELEANWHAHCFAFVLAENRCVVTKFEKDNPVEGAPEVFADNPLCPANPDAFWSTTLDSHVTREHRAAFDLVSAIKQLYKHWNLNYCQGQFLYDTGLHDEPYFRYFDYTDFLTPYSGLIQIRKYAEIHNLQDLQEQFSTISTLTRKVRDELYRLLVEEGRYFG